MSWIYLPFYGRGRNATNFLLCLRFTVHSRVVKMQLFETKGREIGRPKGRPDVEDQGCTPLPGWSAPSAAPPTAAPAPPSIPSSERQM